MGGKPWRDRQCLHCLEVLPDSAFEMLRYDTSDWFEERGHPLRRCPECNLVAPTRCFPVVNQGEEWFVMLVGEDEALRLDEDGWWVA